MVDGINAQARSTMSQVQRRDEQQQYIVAYKNFSTLALLRDTQWSRHRRPFFGLFLPRTHGKACRTPPPSARHQGQPPISLMALEFTGDELRGQFSLGEGRGVREAIDTRTPCLMLPMLNDGLKCVNSFTFYGLRQAIPATSPPCPISSCHSSATG
jgi:hypothetical protein